MKALPSGKAADVLLYIVKRAQLHYIYDKMDTAQLFIAPALGEEYPIHVFTVSNLEVVLDQLVVDLCGISIRPR